jgi:hypothetical protein
VKDEDKDVFLLNFNLLFHQAMGFTQPLREMSTRNIKIIMFLGSKVRRVRWVDNLTAIYEPVVWTMWDP